MSNLVTITLCGTELAKTHVAKAESPRQALCGHHFSCGEISATNDTPEQIEAKDGRPFCELCSVERAMLTVKEWEGA